MKFFVSLVGAALTVACVLAPGVASAGQVSALNQQVTTDGVWGNTAIGSPTIYQTDPNASGICVQQVGAREDWAPQLQSHWLSVPLPCNNLAENGTDEEEVVMTQDSTYEFWLMEWDNAAFPTMWSAAWGGGEPNSNFTQYQGLRAWPATEQHYGAQGSGVAFVPGIITVQDLAQGHIDHPVELLVANACQTFKFPATRADGADTADCVMYGQLFKLPGYVSCSGLKYVAQLVCTAAKKYGLMPTDQTHSAVGFRFENWQRWGGWWSDGNQWDPYYDPAHQDYFGCSASIATYNDSSCYPASYGIFKGFPWGKLKTAN